MSCCSRAPLALAALIVVLSPVYHPRPAQAHTIDTSYATLTVTDAGVDAAFRLDLASLVVPLHLDANGDRQLTTDELEAAAHLAFLYVAAHTALVADNTPVTLEPVPPGHLAADPSGHLFLTLTFRGALPARPSGVSVAVDFFPQLGEQHRHLVRVVAGAQSYTAVLSRQHPVEQFDLRGAGAGRRLAEFLRLGILHIFLGYDHILFLCALLLLPTRFPTLLKIVTAFTVAHSCTLILAALQVVQLPSRFIESAIALSIIYVAVENVWRDRADARWIVTLLFGLVHGFGFANALAELHLPRQGLVPLLLTFNVGVEIGQIGIVALLFPVIRWLATTRFQRQATVVASTAIAACGLGWFIQRAFGLSFMPF